MKDKLIKIIAWTIAIIFIIGIITIALLVFALIIKFLLGLF